MWIIYDCEGEPVGTITDEAIHTTTIKQCLECGDFRVDLCEPYRVVKDEWED